MSRLVLRRGTVASVESQGPPAELIVDCGGVLRPAIAYTELTGPVESADEVVVNIQAVELGLGSGGRDIVHANLTRGLAGTGTDGAHVMKLNYTSLQHAVCPVEQSAGAVQPRVEAPVAVCALHGQLAACVWQAKRRAQRARIGYIQTAGGALVASLSKTARALRKRGLLTGHITVAPCVGAEHEALSVAGAIHAAITTLGWDAAICAPGPGIIGSGSQLGHGGMQALDTAHSALALGCEVIVVPRMSSADLRARHRELSHHTDTVLRLLLAPVTVALPERSSLSIPGVHRARYGHADVAGYSASGLSDATMGRSIAGDRLFFEAALAGGDLLGGTLDGI